MPEYRTKRPEPNIAVFKGTNLQLFATFFESYLRKRGHSELPEVLMELINNAMLRKQISDRLPQKKLSMDLMILKDMFFNSLNVKDDHMTISIRELIEVFNLLLDKIDIVTVEGFSKQEEDPLRTLLEAFGGKRIEEKRN